MNLKHRLLQTVLAWTVLGSFLALSNPGKLPVIILIVPFILLFIAFYSLWNLVRQLVGLYFIDVKPSRHLGRAICVSTVLLLVLQSLGQLTLRDIVTVIAIIVVGYLYLGRSSLGLSRHQ